ncbi:hypothetical protein ACRWY2_20910, partial [Escherichia coli]
VTLKMPAFEWVHVQLHQQKGMISLSPPTICNSAKINNTSGIYFLMLFSISDKWHLYFSPPEYRSTH